MLHLRDMACLAIALALLSAHPAAAQAPSNPADAKAIGRPALAALREAADKNANAGVTRRAKGLIEKIENGLEQLLEDYKSYGLLLPPKDAPLVRFKGYDGFTYNGVDYPTAYVLAFLLKPGTKSEPPETLEKTLRQKLDQNQMLNLLDPAKGTPKEIDDWIAETDRDFFLLAIQCKSRGWNTLAQTLFDGRSKKRERWGPRAQLRHDAWDFWMRKVVGRDTDWQPPAKHLHGLIAADPVFDTPHNRALLKSLDLALAPSNATPGSIEAMIDGLVNATAVSAYFSETSDVNFTQLIEKGFEAVPALLQHRGDDRLTHYHKPPFNNLPGYHCRVSDMAYLLLEGFAGKDLGKDGLLNWWERARKEGEKAYILGHVLPPGYKFPNEYMLRLLVKKYPGRLPDIYRTLLDKHPQMQSWPVVEALERSELSREKEVELYVYAGGHQNLEHRRAAFWRLKELDHKRFVRLLVKTLDGLPKTPTESYWWCKETSFAILVTETRDPGAWQALETAARRVDVGLRMQLMDRISRGGENRLLKARLDFLGAFLDDATVRDLNSDPQRFEGFPAGAKFARLEVRNYAAMEIARILKLEREPEPTWDDKQWEQFREEVREALKR